ISAKPSVARVYPTAAAGRRNPPAAPRGFHRAPLATTLPRRFSGREAMGIRVCKFGGSSVADADQLRKVRAIVEAREDRRFVVPSAPGKRFASDVKVTDLLYRAESATRRPDPEGLSCAQLFDRIAERYRKIVSDLGLAWDMDAALAEVLAKIEGGAGADYAASRGEYLCGLVVARLLDRPFVDPAEMILFDA